MGALDTRGDDSIGYKTQTVGLRTGRTGRTPSPRRLAWRMATAVATSGTRSLHPHDAM